MYWEFDLYNTDVLGIIFDERGYEQDEPIFTRFFRKEHIINFFIRDIKRRKAEKASPKQNQYYEMEYLDFYELEEQVFANLDDDFAFIYDD